MSGTVILEPLGGGLDAKVSSAKGEHVFNAVNRILEQQLQALLDMVRPADSEAKKAAEAAILAWRKKADEFSKAREDESFHVAETGDPMNSLRYARMKSQLEKAAQDIVFGSPSAHLVGHTIFNQRLNGILLVDPSASAVANGGQLHAVDFVSAESVFKKLKSAAKFNEWFRTTMGLMYETISLLLDAALALEK